MPRAFLYTHRRYPKGVENAIDSIQSLPMKVDENTPENLVDQTPDFFNLTQLAEVAAASGQLSLKKISKEQWFTCQDCGKKYTTSSNLARHRQVHRGIDKARKCPDCGKIYVSIPAFSMHLRTHSQPCKCNICGKAFSRPWLLQGHTRTHTGEKPFQCSLCPKSFADKSNLRAHTQTHSSDKPYTCQRCSKSFALKSYLYKHEESSCSKLISAGNDDLGNSVNTAWPLLNQTDNNNIVLNLTKHVSNRNGDNIPNCDIVD